MNIRPADITREPRHEQAAAWFMALHDEEVADETIQGWQQWMVVESNRKIRRVYSIGLGDDPVGHKEQRGDSRTPEGSYQINFKHDKSRYHLSMRISYPDARDRAHAKKLRVRPGGDIMIHGTPNGLEWWRTLLLERDWTDGCIAVTNQEIAEIWALVRVGTRVDIRP